MNAAQAYIVNDIYIKYINPTASARKTISMNYLVGVVVVAAGVIFGFFAKDVSGVLQWIVSALYGGYVASNVLKWHWWRFNATGFFWGMLTGIVVALIFSHFIDDSDLLYWFPVTFALSLAGSFIGSYSSPPTDMAVLKSFYSTVRPWWGFWEPIKGAVLAEDPSFQPNKNFKINMFNVVIGTGAQCCLTILPMYLVLRQRMPLLVTIAILVVIVIILKKTWWNKLKDY
jgi:SSS family solute:Na+ symporter